MQLQSKKYMSMMIVCAWCKKIMELKGVDRAEDEITSHGCCQSCYDTVMGQATDPVLEMDLYVQICQSRS